MIVTGVARVNFGIKGAAFYQHNPIFWTKIGLFVLVGLLSIPPTIAYIRWGRRNASGSAIALEGGEYVPMRVFLWLELIVFLFIPLCAVFMARGLGFNLGR